MELNSFQRWFRVFVEEKNLDMSEFVPCSDGTLQVGDVCSVIMSCPPEEQHQIKRQLVQIDVRNGDVMHFIKYLALKLTEAHKVSYERK